MDTIDGLYHRAVSPLIILGMHRSGTTMLTRMLEQRPCDRMRRNADRDRIESRSHFRRYPRRPS